MTRPRETYEGAPQRLVLGMSYLGSLHPMPLDKNGDYVRVVDAEHARIHEEIAFISTGIHSGSVAAGSYYDTRFWFASNSVDIHFRNFTFDIDQTPAVLEFYEGGDLTTIATTGTAHRIFNPVRTSSNQVSNLKIYDTSTVNTVGALIWDKTLPAGGQKSIGTLNDEIPEWHLRPFTVYTLRLWNFGNQVMSFDHSFFWYEPPIYVVPV